MKNFYKSLKQSVTTDGNLSKSESRKGKLYVAYLNKAMIDTCTTVNDQNNDPEKYQALVFSTSNGTYYKNGGIPVIFSQDDEMVLYDEESSEYY